MRTQTSSTHCAQYAQEVNVVSACRWRHDIVHVRARKSRLCTLGSPGKATACMVVVAVGRTAGSIAVAGYHSHSRHRCGTAGVAHALLGLSNRASGMRPEFAAVSA